MECIYGRALLILHKLKLLSIVQKTYIQTQFEIVYMLISIANRISFQACGFVAALWSTRNCSYFLLVNIRYWYYIRMQSWSFVFPMVMVMVMLCWVYNIQRSSRDKEHRINFCATVGLTAITSIRVYLKSSKPHILVPHFAGGIVCNAVLLH